MKEKLEQYRAICREINQLERQMSSLKPEILSDGVTGSRPTIPYDQHSITIRGMGLTRKSEALLEKWRERVERLVNERVEIEHFIDGIQDSEMRQILTLRYLQPDRKKTSYFHIALALGHYDEQHPRKREQRFWAEYKQK